MRNKIKSFIVLFIFLLGVQNIHAQVDDYEFQTVFERTGSIDKSFLNYSSLPDNSQAMKYLYVNSSLDGSKALSATGNGVPIGFDFWYDGQVFDRVAISGNGYIKLGRSGEPITIVQDTIAGAIFDGAKEHQNIIATFQAGKDLVNKKYMSLGYYGIRVGTVGIPGNRVFIVDIGHYSGGEIEQGAIHIYSQIQLWEHNHQIQYVYGLNIPSWNNSMFQGAVGITGKNDFSSRRVTIGTDTWSNSSKGLTMNDLCDIKAGFSPVTSTPSGFNYRWTPDSIPPSKAVCPEAYTYVNKDYPGGIKIPEVGLLDNGLNGGYFIYLNNADSIPTNSILEWSNSSWQSNQETQYDVYLDTDNPPIIQVANNISEPLYNPGQLAPNTTYYLKLVPQNDSGSVEGCITTFTTAAEIGYCEPYNYGAGYLQQFLLNELAFNRTSANELSAQFPQESPYTTGLKRDTSYQVAVTLAGQSPNSPWTAAAVEVFIDFNQDGDFKDEGETLYGGYDNPNQSFTFDLDIPKAARLGTTLMRVRTRSGQVSTPTDACKDYWMGGRQDYTITILPQTGCEDFSINPITQNLLCYQDSSGSIQLNPSGGQTPYTVEWLSESNTELNRTNLKKGIYQARVSDINGCTYQTPLIAITQPQAIYLEDSVYEEGTAINAQGGTPPYNYLWDNGTNEYHTDTPPQGADTLITTDANGCKDTTENVQIDPATGMEHYRTTSNVHVYPNPVQDGKLQISAKEPIDYIEIRNVLGVQVAYKKVNATTTEVHMEKENRGIYFVTVKTQTQEVVQRVLVEK